MLRRSWYFKCISQVMCLGVALLIIMVLTGLFSFSCDISTHSGCRFCWEVKTLVVVHALALCVIVLAVSYTLKLLCVHTQAPWTGDHIFICGDRGLRYQRCKVSGCCHWNLGSHGKHDYCDIYLIRIYNICFWYC